MRIGPALAKLNGATDNLLQPFISALRRPSSAEAPTTESAVVEPQLREISLSL
jgi:hypothetical protein